MSYNWFYLCVCVAIATLPQLGLLLWWGSNLSTRVKQLEKEHDKLGDQVDALGKLETRIAIVESILNNQTEVLREIRDRLPSTQIIRSN